MFKLVAVLVQLTGPANQTIWVNPEEVVSVRAPRGEHFPRSVRCVLQTADGKLIPIVELCDDARGKLGVFQ